MATCQPWLFRKDLSLTWKLPPWWFKWPALGVVVGRVFWWGHGTTCWWWWWWFQWWLHHGRLTWQIQNTRFKGKWSSKPPWLCSMLIFRGCKVLMFTPQHSGRFRYSTLFLQVSFAPKFAKIRQCTHKKKSLHFFVKWTYKHGSCFDSNHGNLVRKNGGNLAVMLLVQN